MSQIPIILDCDPGHDDALAIILAAYNPKIDLRGIVTVSGNGAIDKVTYNALSICTLAKIRVPVAQGSGVSILGSAEAATDIHGETALDGAPLPKPTFELSKESGIELMARLVRESSEPITIVATGPLTNVAILLKCGLDVTHQALVTKEVFTRLEALKTDLSKTIIGLLKFFAQTYNDVFEMPDPPLHDPVAIAVLIDPSVVSSRFVNVEVELDGKFTRGATVVDIYKREERAANTTVALDLDAKKFWNLMIDAIEAAGKS